MKIWLKNPVMRDGIFLFRGAHLDLIIITGAGFMPGYEGCDGRERILELKITDNI